MAGVEVASGTGTKEIVGDVDADVSGEEVIGCVSMTVEVVVEVVLVVAAKAAGKAPAELGRTSVKASNSLSSVSSKVLEFG